MSTIERLKAAAQKEQEAEDERLNKIAEEYYQRRWKSAYDCYCGCVRNKYG